MPGPFAALVLGALLLSGCTAPGLILTGMGIATDTSMTWDIVKHVHAQITADDPTPCAMLNSVQRALNARCPFEPGSIKTADLAKSGLQGCPLSVATSDMRVWRALPELIEKGAKSESCARAPLQDLAEADACPDFQSASPEVLKAIVHLAETDPRSVRHDVFRMFSCPRARAAGLDRVLVGWLDAGKLQPGTLSFSPLEAIDPQLLVSRFGRELQTAGHSPSAALDNYDGALPSGFEEALRTANWTALEWWFFELPQLANIAPPSRGGQMSWVPLQRVLLPGFLADSAAQPEMVSFLLAHGANPRQKLPFDTSRTVIGFAKAIKSPVLTLLDAPAPALPSAIPATALASNGEAAGGARPQRDGGSLRPVAARFDPPATGGESASR